MVEKVLKFKEEKDKFLLKYTLDKEDMKKFSRDKERVEGLLERIVEREEETKIKLENEQEKSSKLS